MNQFLSNKIIAGIVALALLVGVGVLISSGDTSSTTRNAALVVATPCTKPGQVTKVSKQSVVCATTKTGSLWYATMKAKGKAQACKSPGAIRKKSKIVWVCGVIKKKKLWQATQPLPPAVVASTTAIEPGATQPTPALDSTQVATPEAPVVADNTVLADTKIPDDKIVTKVIDDVAPTQTLAPAVPAALSLVTQPSGGANAAALKTQPVVQLLDQRGASISTAGITITAVSGRTDVVLSGNTAITDATGRATFTTLSLTGIMGDITLTFTASGLEGITSDKFVLAAGAATRLVNNTTTGSVVSGKAFDQQPVLHFEDSSANVIAVSGVEVIVASSTQGLSGTTTVATNKNGVAEFTDLALTQAGLTTLTFTSGELSTTTKVTVVAGDYTTVKITTEASQAATNNTAFSQSPVVQLVDANNNKVITADITVTATITQFPTADTNNAATLLNSTARTNDKGVATFTGLGITGLIGAYILGYTPTNGVTEASEKTTTLSAGVTTQLIVLTAAAGPVGDDALGKWSLKQSPVIGLLDSSNNPVPTSGVTVTATVTGQAPTTAPTTAPTNTEGEATILITFSGANADDREITYSALRLQTNPTTINLPLLTPVVSPTWELPGAKTTTSDAFQLTAPTSNSGGAWAYTSSNATVATVNRDSGLITLLRVAGTTIITATQAATTKYESTTTAANLVIALTTPTVALWTVPDNKNTSSDAFQLTAPTSNSPQAWTYTSSNTTVATVNRDSGLITLLRVAGTTIITATQAATTKYESVQRAANLVIGRTTPTVTWNIDTSRMRCKCSDPFTLTAPTSNSPQAWTYTSSNPEVATVATATISRPDLTTYQVATVTLNNVAGTTNITATQAETTKYTSSATLPKTLTITDDYSIGTLGPGGGIVFYAASVPFDCGVDLKAKCTYLEAAPSDYSSMVEWCSNTNTALGVTAQGIGSGMSNTTTADNTCTSGAIQVAADYTTTTKTDWYLPSQAELNQLYNQIGTVGGFAANRYWSSSEYYADFAWSQHFRNGVPSSLFKTSTYYVRPVRAF